MMNSNSPGLENSSSPNRPPINHNRSIAQRNNLINSRNKKAPTKVVSALSSGDTIYTLKET